MIALTTSVCLRNIATVAGRWSKLENEFGVKSQYAELDLLTSFSDMRCSSTSQVCTYLEQMMSSTRNTQLYESVSDKGYQSAILKAIHEAMMSKFASNLLTEKDDVVSEHDGCD